MTDAFGAITWWGFSPALDLQDEDYITALKKLHITDAANKELNFLLIGAGDLRHVLKTIARSYRHPKRKLHFYVLENNLELYARDMLFLSIALEPQSRMGLQEKTELFLELYGNILVRKQSEDYVQIMTAEFIKMVTNLDYLEKKLPAIDLSQLKFKERDFIEAIFKFWKNPDVKGVFDVARYWDLRQRKLLGVRYDSKENVYDWDYHMRMAQREADIINIREYKSWRNTGVAFEVREADYDTPNKTLSSGLILEHQGEMHARRGYWGDILVSPYIALGIECEEKSFFKKTNQLYTKTATNVAVYNVLSMVHEIATKTRYVLPEVKKPNEEEVSKLTEISENDEIQKEDNIEIIKEIVENIKEEVTEKLEEKKPLEEEFAPLPLEDVQITFLSLGSLLDLGKKSKYQKLFQIIYFSNSMVHLLKPQLTPIFADAATVVIESARYMLELKLEQVKLFVEKVEGMAQEAGCTRLDQLNPETANFIKMAFERKEES